MKTCCFTGHRPESLLFGYRESSPEFIKFKNVLRHTIIDLYLDGYKNFYTGMAEGVDIWAAEIIISLNEELKDLNLYAAIPYPVNKQGTSAFPKSRYNNILEHVENIIYTSDHYSQDCFKIRNYYMVDNSDAVLAVYNVNKFRSGTGQTVRYAQKKGMPVIMINPITFEKTFL